MNVVEPARRKPHGRAVRRAVRMLAPLALLLLAGCPVNDLLDASNRAGLGPSDAGPDVTSESSKGSTSGASTASSASQASSSAGSSAGASGPYYDLSDTQRWTFFDVTTVAGGTTTFSGVAFDGRYLYFVPNFSPPAVLRYDTHGSFTATASWTTYTPMPTIEAAGGSSSGSYAYLGGAFDGRYVVFAPYGSKPANPYALQYDTQQPFTQSSAWSAFDTTSIDANANYWGAVSDGRFTYLVPNGATKVLAYDKMAAADAGSGFSSAASWTAYDLGAGNGGLWGGTYDGKYVTFAPFSGSVATRHDTTQAVNAAASWDVGATGFDFDNNEGIAAPDHFWAGAFDGHHVYILPFKTPSWPLAAFSTSGQFGDDTAWTTCPLTSLFAETGSVGFAGAAFDGKRLILAPTGSLETANGGNAALPVVAYDTTQPLCPSDMTTAYATMDPTTLDGGAAAQGFEGAAFDGQYVYFVPHTNGIVARFEAKSMNSGLAPAGYTGSWW